MRPAELPSTWRARAEQLEPFAPAAARAFRDAAAELAMALSATEAEALTLAEASRESGYSERHLRGLVAGGELPNAGRRGRPRIRRGDLPRKPRRAARDGDYDPEEHARELVD